MQLGNDYGLDGEIAKTTFPTVSFYGQKRRALSEKDAGATKEAPTGSMIDACMSVPAEVDEARYLEVFGR